MKFVILAGSSGTSSGLFQEKLFLNNFKIK